jgi:hypothetical protein
LCQVTVTDNGGLTFTQAFTIIINYVAAPPGVSNTAMSIAENSVSGSLVGTMTNSGTEVYTFTPIAAGTTPAAALTVFRVQACSGTVFVNSVCVSQVVLLACGNPLATRDHLAFALWFLSINGFGLVVLFVYCSGSVGLRAWDPHVHPGNECHWRLVVGRVCHHHGMC